MARLLALDRNVEGAPPFDYDPFVGGQEELISFHVGKAKISGDQATVPIALRVGRLSRAAEGVVIHRQVQLFLRDGRWLIDDVIYGPNSGLRDVIIELEKEYPG